MAFAGFLPCHLGLLLVYHFRSSQYFAMYFKTLNSSCRWVSDRTDHKNDWTSCSDSIFDLTSYNYSEIADMAQVLTSFNFLRNR